MPAFAPACFAADPGYFGRNSPRRFRENSWVPGKPATGRATAKRLAQRSMIFALMLLSSTAATVRPAVARERCLATPLSLPADAKPAPLNNPEWKAQYERLRSTVAEPRMASRHLLFIGDSLTFGWHADETLFYQTFKQFNPLNLGIYGDRTEGVIYRLNSDWGALNPRLAVVLIGTNNTATGSTPANVAMAITEIVRTIRAHSGQTRVLIVSILPRGENQSALRSANTRVNEIVAACVNGETTFFTDVSASFLDDRGGFRQELTTDNVHLTRNGYQQLATLILPTIKTLMKE